MILKIKVFEPLKKFYLDFRSLNRIKHKHCGKNSYWCNPEPNDDRESVIKESRCDQRTKCRHKNSYCSENHCCIGGDLDTDDDNRKETNILLEALRLIEQAKYTKEY